MDEWKNAKMHLVAFMSCQFFCGFEINLMRHLADGVINGEVMFVGKTS